MDAITEKREGQRFRVRMFVMGEFKNNVFSSTTQNISVSGMLVETEKVLAKGDTITCSFVLQHKMTVSGEVARVAKKKANLYDYGIRFLNLDPKAKGKIEDALRSGKKP
jgi:c-di-GMP-binding flagellar brake protein YcgR